MTASATDTLTPLETQDGEFMVTDAMFLEVQRIAKFDAFATHAVIYPERHAGLGWDFEVTSGRRTAVRLARRIGSGAEVVTL